MIWLFFNAIQNLYSLYIVHTILFAGSNFQRLTFNAATDINFQGATIGLISGVLMALWMNTGYYSSGAHISYLDTNVENCTFYGNDTAREIPPDK